MIESYHFGLVLGPEEAILGEIAQNDSLGVEDLTIDVDIVDGNAKDAVEDLVEVLVRHVGGDARGVGREYRVLLDHSLQANKSTYSQLTSTARSGDVQTDVLLHLPF